LGIPEIFYRFAGRTAIRLTNTVVGPSLLPTQLGIGIKSGCQIGAKAAQCAFDSNLAVISNDQKNAYGTESRIGTFEGLRKYAPEMLAFYM
jgi:hypothetical protein